MRGKESGAIAGGTTDRQMSSCLRRCSGDPLPEPHSNMLSNLVDSALMSKRVGSDDSLVGLNSHTGKICHLPGGEKCNILLFRKQAGVLTTVKVSQ